MSLEHQLRAGWLRARVTTPEEDQPFYSNSPLIKALEARTIGGTIEAVQAEVIEGRGASDCPKAYPDSASRWPAPRSSRRASPLVLEVSDEEEGWQEWMEVSDFAQSQPDDRHFVLDAVAGEVLLGPAVRMPDGELLGYGAVPSKGSVAAPAPLPHRRRPPGQRGPDARSGCPGRRFRTWPGSRTATPRRAASTARTSKKPRSAARS